jgi:hypothetical protein
MRWLRQAMRLRASIAMAAAYALAINLILAGGLGGPLIAVEDGSGGFEICLGHDGDSDQQSPALPDAGKFHCVLCIAGSDAPVLPATTVVTMALGHGAIISAERADDTSPPHAPRDPGKPPTGPPLTA